MGLPQTGLARGRNVRRLDLETEAARFEEEGLDLDGGSQPEKVLHRIHHRQDAGLIHLGVAEDFEHPARVGPRPASARRFQEEAAADFP